MSVKGTYNEAVGTAREEINEALGNKQAAREGRDQRNAGRVANGKMPKLTEPGTSN